MTSMPLGAMLIMPVMKGQIDTVEDDFWTEHRELFTAQFPSYYTKPQKVRGRFHTSEEKFPHAQTFATPFNDPIAQSIEEYQGFLKSLGYSPISKAAFGKKIR